MERKKRSEALAPEELKAFRKHFSSFNTKEDAAAFYGLSRQVLDGVNLRGSGAPDSIEKIREKTPVAAAA